MNERIFKARAANSVVYIIIALIFWFMSIVVVALGLSDDSVPFLWIAAIGVFLIIAGILMIMAAIRLRKFFIKIEDKGITINKKKKTEFYSFEECHFSGKLVRYRNSVTYYLRIAKPGTKEIDENTYLSKKDFESLMEAIEHRNMQRPMGESRFEESSNFEEVFMQKREFILNKEKIRKSAKNPVIFTVITIVCFGAAYLLTFTLREKLMVYPILFGLMSFVGIFLELSKYKKNTKRTPNRVIVDNNSITFDDFTIPYNAIISIVATSTMQTNNSSSREMQLHTTEQKYRYNLGFVNDGTGNKVVLSQADYNSLIELLKNAFINRPDVLKMRFKG